jgi:hypothetical protein
MQNRYIVYVQTQSTPFIEEYVMKFVPKLCAAVGILLLSACSSPAPETGSVAEEAKIVIGEGMPKPTQTTWATPESTITDQPKTQTEAPVSSLPSCDGLDKTIVFLYTKSEMKCVQLLELRDQLLQSFGEDEVDFALLQYHNRYCTEFGGQGGGEMLPYDPSHKTSGEEAIYRTKPGASEPQGDTADRKLGKYVPCRQPAALTK